MQTSAPLSFFDKVWRDHAITEIEEGVWLLQIDRLLIHDVNGGPIIREMQAGGHRPASPRQVFGIVDHGISTTPVAEPRGTRGTWTQVGGQMIAQVRALTREFGIRLIDSDDPSQGISNVVGAELGLALPGLTVVCGDSHTCTLGGIGALAWGIGTSEGVHVLATQTLVQAKPKTMRVNFDGALSFGVSAKDLALHLIGQIGAGAGSGYAVEFAGSTVSDLSVEGRLTLCNMAVEFSAKYGFVPPDEKTIDYLRGREAAPSGAAWERAVASWRALASDPGAVYDLEVRVDSGTVQPQVTWGTSPQHAIAIGAPVPNPSSFTDAATAALAHRALEYQQLQPGQHLRDVAIDAAYIGSCTNARLSDLRLAADFLRGRKVAPNVIAICVPGSSIVKRQAEAEGLDEVFRDAGFEWHEAGCAMCGSSRGRLEGLRVIGTTNRNFENRQGRGTRTHLASPLTVAASAVAGHIADARGA